MEDRAYYHIPAETLGAEAKIPLAKMGDSDEVFRAMADMMADCIKENNAGGKRTVFICPVGPVGQYAFFVRRVNEEGISLKDVWFSIWTSIWRTTVPTSARTAPCPSGAS